MPGLQGFNGAAAKSSGKFGEFVEYYSRLAWLQWGRR